MFNLVRALKIMLHQDKAFQLTGYGRYQEALNHIEAAENIGYPRNNVNKTRVELQARILKGLLELKTKNYNESLKILVDVQEHLLRIPKQTPEVVYLECYVSVLAGDSLRTLGNTDLVRRGFAIFNVPYEAVNVNAVPVNVKRKFPLRSHPEWRDKF